MKISLVTACYNAAKTIDTAFESVMRQRLGNDVELEYVIVDGASKDGTLEKITAFVDRVQDSVPHLSVAYVSERDRGLYDAINKGIRMASGDVVGILNADDILASDDVMENVARAFSENLDGIYADIRFVREGNTVEALRNSATVRYCTGKFFRNWMFRFATFPAHPSIYLRKSCFEKYGYYSIDYRICADFELMLRLFCTNKIRVRYIPLCTTILRTGGLSTGGVLSNVEINREDLRALKANGYWSCLPLIYMKYFFKIWGFLRRR